VALDKLIFYELFTHVLDWISGLNSRFVTATGSVETHQNFYAILLLCTHNFTYVSFVAV